jgi:predicted nucleic acid-binding Zn ribbon protein
VNAYDDQVVELYQYRCDICRTILDLGQHAHVTNPSCPSCGLRMNRHSTSSVLVPVGHRFRSGPCRGCNRQIQLVPMHKWQDLCVSCRDSRDDHAAKGASPLEWLAPTETRRRVSDRLLEQALGADF